MHRQRNVIYSEYYANRYSQARYQGQRPHRNRASPEPDSIDLPRRYRWIYVIAERPPYPRCQNSGLFHYR
jgi:hypothetical protein